MNRKDNSTLTLSNFTSFLQSTWFLRVTGALWIALVSLCITVFGLTVYLFARYVFEAPQPELLEALQALKIPLGWHYGYNVAVYTLVFVVSAAVAGVLYWQRPYEPMVILTAVFLLCFGAYAYPLGLLDYMNSNAGGLVDVFRGLQLVPALLSWPLLGLFIFLFPDGRFVPRIFGGVLGVYGVIFAIAWGMFPQVFANPQGIMTVIVPLSTSVIFLGGIGAQWYRFRRVSGVVQRQQTKWFLYGFTIVALLAVAIVAGTAVIHANLSGNAQRLFAVWDQELVSPLLNVGYLCIPVSLLFALMRYRLWDIDWVINRSLAYAIATVLLIAMAVGTVLLFRAALAGANVFVAVTFSALPPILLFNPIRRRTQALIDHQLYGLRYDQHDLAQAKKPLAVVNVGALSGQMLGGYTLTDVLGRGGMGEVYCGERSKDRVAIKVLADNLADKEEYRTRFQREAETGMMLQHPNIAQVYGTAQQEGVIYMTMQLIVGHDLRQRLEQQEVLSFEQTLSILQDVSAALDYAHAQRVVHRDLKPSNVMLTGSGAVLMDFGVAKFDDGRTRFTGDGMIGTIDYMSPEQIMASGTVDARTDIYALGVMAYEMFTGRPPFEGGSGQVMFAHLQQPPPDARLVNPKITYAAARAIQRAMAKTPDERFSSATAFVAALM
ncbi:MAG: serine/threonine-protein kinase [Phototrophicaceae bacterium]|jgi:serine/threonine-protein kinase